MTAPTRESLRRDARDIVDAALRDYGGPCSQAYADVLRAYIAAPEGGRDALFLEVAFRAVGRSGDSDQRHADAVQRRVEPLGQHPATTVGR